MLTYIIIIIALLCVYITIKEGLDEAVYKPPSELMNTMTNIMNGEQTDSTKLNIDLQRHTGEIDTFNTPITSMSGQISGKLQKCQNAIPGLTNSIISINNSKMNFILYQIGVQDINALAAYIQKLDDTYTRLQNVNVELINKKNLYNSGYNILSINPITLTPLNDIIQKCIDAGFNINKQTSQIK